MPVAVVVVAFPMATARETESVAPETPDFVVVGESYNDYPSAVVIDLELSDPPQIRIQTSGLVTSSLFAGGSIENGQPLISVNNIAVLSFKSSAPLFRDLEVGAEGNDVELLEKYLSEVGLLDAESVDAQFNRSTTNAVKVFQRNLGVEEDGVFRPSYVAFVPQDAAALDSLHFRAGDSVAAGDVITTGTATAQAISFRAEDEQGNLSSLTEGNLVLRFGTTEVPLPGLTIPPAEILPIASAIEAAVVAGSAQEENDETSNRSAVTGGVLSLADGESGAVVPSTAIYVSSSGKKCLFAQSEDTDELVAHEVTNLQPALGAIGSVFVPDSLRGLSVARDSSFATDTLRAQCV